MRPIITLIIDCKQQIFLLYGLQSTCKNGYIKSINADAQRRKGYFVTMLKQILEIEDLLDGMVTGNDVADFLRAHGAKDVTMVPIEGKRGHTDFIKICIHGKNGKSEGRDKLTLGIIGRLGGIGARLDRIGMVSDTNGAIVALAVALKLIKMQKRGDQLPGDVIICTHICPTAPTLPHKPVPFMNSPVDMGTLNEYEVTREMDAILSVDATKGNNILNLKIPCGLPQVDSEVL